MIVKIFITYFFLIFTSNSILAQNTQNFKLWDDYSKFCDF